MSQAFFLSELSERAPQNNCTPTHEGVPGVVQKTTETKAIAGSAAKQLKTPPSKKHQPTFLRNGVLSALLVTLGVKPEI